MIPSASRFIFGICNTFRHTLILDIGFDEINQNLFRVNAVLDSKAMLEKELELAESLAREAGAKILEYFRGDFEVETKESIGRFDEPVTIADRESSRLIVGGIEKAFQNDAILSEEEEDDTQRRLRSERVWITDPLDGTKGFAEGEGDFAVQIALVIKGRPSVGVVFQPVGDVMYSAIKGSGCFLSIKGSEKQRLETSDKTEYSEMTMAVSRSHRSRRMDRVFKHFGIEKEYPHGSVGLKTGFVARQIADIYLHMSPHTKFWDTAAPQVIIEEAGGRLTDIFGDEIDYTLADVKNHNGLFVSNGACHEDAVERLKPLLTEFGRLRVTKGNN